MNQCKWSEEEGISSVLLFKSLPRNWRYNFSHFQFVAEESWNKLNCSLILLNNQIFLVLHKLNIKHFTSMIFTPFWLTTSLRWQVKQTHEILWTAGQSVFKHICSNSQTFCLSGYSEEHTSEWFLKLNNSPSSWWWVLMRTGSILQWVSPSMGNQWKSKKTRSWSLNQSLKVNKLWSLI